MKCKSSSCDKPVLREDKRSLYCSKQCKNVNAVRTRRKRIKLIAVKYMGGSCRKCGYDKCMQALEFHHLDPEHKDFSIATKGTTRSWARVKKELDKCILLCSNCHAELHSKGGE